jgi:hypothetical protein
MKNSSWIVELQNPINLTESVWYCSAETLEKVCNKWYEETSNHFLNYSKLHNIYHNRNKSDNIFIKVKKVKQSIGLAI